MRLFISALALVLLSAPVLAQDSSALINKALDEKVNLVLDKPLPEALKLITQKTGVRIKEDPVIWDLLPWGPDTVVQIKAENVTLREALQKMAAKVGLVIRLRPEYLALLPSEPLRRIGQRASRDEIRALDILGSQQASLGTDHPTVGQLLEAVDLKLAGSKDVPLAIENRITDIVKQDRTVFVPRNATLADALESITKETRGTWYPWGRNIVVVGKDDRTRALLARPLSMRGGAGGMDILQLILDIAARTGVPIEMQPGLLQSLPPEARILRGADGRPPVLENVPAQQILDIISATTGIAFTIEDDKVIASAATNTPAPRERAIGLIQLDNGLQVLLPTSAVPPDIQEYIRYKSLQKIEALRAQMEKEGFRPTTRPAPAR